MCEELKLYETDLSTPLEDLEPLYTGDDLSEAHCFGLDANTTIVDAGQKT